MVELVQSGLDDLIPMVGRSEGKHVSHAIKRLCLQFGHYEDLPLPEDRSLLELGSAFEDLLAEKLCERVAKSEPDRYMRIGEQEKDGIYGTPDLVDIIERAVVEVKFTRFSIRQDPYGKGFWRYWAQIKAYCAMLEMDTGYLHVAHINGNYNRSRTESIPCPHCGKPGEGSHYHVWKGTFNESELHDNWAMVRAYA